MASFSPAYIGVTGTNGKTSCAWWLAQLLCDVGQKPGLIGTLGCGVWSKDKKVELRETGYTTPDAKLLQNILAEFAEQGATHVVMEVSSHGLQQGRVSAITFSSALFTNLSHDHLDYHGNMDNYAAAKARLFSFPGLKHAIINLDDDFGRTLISRITTVPVLSYSLANPAADVYVKNMELDASGLRGVLVTPWGNAALVAPIAGDFNVANLLGVISVLCAEGFVLDHVLDAVKNLQSPPGRLQRVVADDVASEITVFVDFAHTPDALEKVLSTLKKQTRQHLWCVFGCGGDRDSSKRAVMGQVVSRLADHSIVTSDNPRSEHPQDIINQILSGMDQGNTAVMADRKSAILYAIHHASAGDVVLIAGKGHENYQEINGNKIPFSDMHEATMALRERAQTHRVGSQP